MGSGRGWTNVYNAEVGGAEAICKMLRCIGCGRGWNNAYMQRRWEELSHSISRTAVVGKHCLTEICCERSQIRIFVNFPWFPNCGGRRYMFLNILWIARQYQLQSRMLWEWGIAQICWRCYEVYASFALMISCHKAMSVTGLTAVSWIIM